MEYNLEKRTTEFNKSLISASRKIVKTSYNQNIVGQLLRSGTSIGANYREANGSVSKKDFSNKIHICKKEAKETLYWLELLSESEPVYSSRISHLIQEANELTLIFSKIASSSR